MAGVNDRVQGFLDNWAIVKEQLEEVLEENERILISNRACPSFCCQPKDDLSETLG
jgi:hypothetical protein